jgi:hypothetical protein
MIVADKDKCGINKRPTSVTVIAWLLIVSEGIFLITDHGRLLTVRDTISNSTIYIFQLILNYIRISFPLISGIGILKRQNWARFLYLTCWIIFFVIYIVRKPMTSSLIGATVLFLIAIFFLFRPQANNYFAARDPKNSVG